jgi:M6 family metalloprotease-like protein
MSAPVTPLTRRNGLPLTRLAHATASALVCGVLLLGWQLLASGQRDRSPADLVRDVSGEGRGHGQQPSWQLPGQPLALSGWFAIVWADPPRGVTEAPPPVYLLFDDAGGSTRLMLDETQVAGQGGVLALNRKRVRVQGVVQETAPGVAAPAGPAARALRVTWIELAEPQALAPLAEESPLEAVTGSQPWISIMCKFQDVAALPETLSYFQGMYDSTYPGLDHYWREVSYNQVNVVGSGVAGSGWFTLPQPRSYYVYYVGGTLTLDFTRAANDCTQQADPYVYFPNYVGINLMFNDDLDGYAWGGSQPMTLDGVTRYWRMTWEPPWGYHDIVVIAHEMGHGFGLPHSSAGSARAPYDNRWDVMSDTWKDCSRLTDATYGCLGQHTISYHKDLLGWIPARQKFTAGAGQASVTLERLAQPASGNYLMATVPIATGHHYTVESRRWSGVAPPGSYDWKLPFEAVIIHDVVEGRTEPAHLVNSGDPYGPGAMWTPGEVFSDPTNRIAVSVDAATGSGFQVTITTVSPTITTLTPAAGVAGTVVTITGSGFVKNATSVTFDGISASGVTVVTGATLTATAPAHAPGAVTVSVTTPNGTASLAGGFTYGGQPPTLASISPARGATTGGTQVTLTGSSFVSSGTSVTFGGAPATSVSVTNSALLTAISPAHAAGLVAVGVSTAAGSASLINAFTYDEPPLPTLTAINPTSGPSSGGQLVTLTGTNFRAGETAVTIGGAAATQVTVISPATLTALTPPGSGQAVPVVVTTPGGGATLAAAYTYLFNRYFAEGAISSFFDCFFALANPGAAPIDVALQFQKTDGTTVPYTLTVPALQRRTVNAKDALGYPPASAEFSTVVEAAGPVLADRTMTWDSANHYGAHSERSVGEPSTRWYLAEGATHSGFNLFYLFQNPGATPATVQAQYLLPAPQPPVNRTYTVQPHSRFNVWVNRDSALVSTDLSATITSDVPIIVERAMYLNALGLMFKAGHESAGVTSPSPDWFLAEGATGSYFDLFILIANPASATADVTGTYLLPDGSTVTKTYSVAGHSRFNIWVDLEDARLANTAVSTTMHSTQPVIVERAMWWPGPTAATWFEAHNSPGAVQTGVKWGLAEGEVNAAIGEDTYILIANTSRYVGSARVTLLFEDGTTPVSKDFSLPANSRTNVDVSFEFGAAAAGKRFGAIVESLGGTPAQIVVERAMYWNALGVTWSAGTNALGTRLQ